jgi:hypothetical protein
VNGLVDSGCLGRSFIDTDLVRKHGIPTQTLPRTRTLLLANSRASATLTDYVLTLIMIGYYNEYNLFFVTSLLKDTPVILGLP